MGQQALLEIMSVRWIWGNDIVDRTEGLYLSGYVTYLGDLPLVAVVCVLGVVFQGLWACELVVAGRGGADVTLACDLSGKACDRARYWGLKVLGLFRYPMTSVCQCRSSHLGRSR